MTDKPIRSNKPDQLDRKPVMLTILSLASLVILLVMLVYLGSKLERLEDKLAYQPPSAPGSNAAGDSKQRDIPLDTNVIYVPVYSHIYATGGTPVLLETTLSIRNTDPENTIVISSIRYFDTKGKLVKEYLGEDLQLGSLESTEVLVEKRDSRGGSGANFIVSWKSDKPVYKPIIEAIMIGKAKNQDISFLSSGRQLTQRIEH